MPHPIPHPATLPLVAPTCTFLDVAVDNAHDVNPEEAVRLYLMYLEDPGSLRDPAEIQRKTVAVLEAKDPIEKLRALAEVERASAVDDDVLREGFVRHGKAWADQNGIPVSAFLELKVPDDVLQEAGFEVPLRRPRRGRQAASSASSRQRAKAVPVDAIKSHILERTGTFVLADIQSGVGGCPATLRKAVEELVEAGRVERLGPDQDYRGRGRAPILYSVA